MGDVPVTLQLGQWTCEEDIHIYPGVSDVIVSWKAAKALHTLPHHYPYPTGGSLTVVQRTSVWLLDINDHSDQVERAMYLSSTYKSVLVNPQDYGIL